MGEERTSEHERLTSGVAILEAHDIRKRFGGVVAVDGVSLAVPPGTVKTVVWQLQHGRRPAPSGNQMCDTVGDTHCLPAKAPPYTSAAAIPSLQPRCNNDSWQSTVIRTLPQRQSRVLRNCPRRRQT